MITKHLNEIFRNSEIINLIANKEEIDIEEFTTTLLTTPEVKERNKLISEYFNVLNNHKDCTSEHFVTCSDLSTKFKTVLKKHDTLPKQLQKTWKKTEETFSRGLKQLHNLKIVKENSTKTFGLYPEYNCLLLELPLTDKKLKPIFKQLNEDSKNCDPHLAKKRLEAKGSSTHTRISKTVNASIIDNFILSAYPEDPEHLSDFFSETIIKHKCPLWVTLNQVEEIKKMKGAFWSNANLKNLKLGDWKITNITENEQQNELQGEFDLKTPRLITSQLLATNGNEERKITHIYYKGWEDFMEAPDEKVLDDCLETILKNIVQGDESIGFNCKAGIGRSGITIISTLARMEILKQIANKVSLNEITINIPEITYRIRQKRCSSSPGTFDQFKQIYQMTSRFIKRQYMSLTDLTTL